MQCVFKQQLINFLLANLEFFLSLSRQALVVLIFILVSACSAYSVHIVNTAENQHFKRDQTVKHHHCSQNEALKIMTLNMAHGRKEAFNHLRFC